MNKYSDACCSNMSARVAPSRSRRAVHLPQRPWPDARWQVFSFLIQPPDALHSWHAASISSRRRRWRPAQPLAGLLASQRARATAGCSRAHATRPPLRRAAVRVSVRGSGETLRARRRRGVSGACSGACLQFAVRPLVLSWPCSPDVLFSTVERAVAPVL